MSPAGVLAPPASVERAAPLPWHLRLREQVVAYLPLLLMALLASGTWWLVKSTPVPEAQRPAAPARHEADYTMNDFTVQRFATNGPLHVQIEGDQLRHYPDTDTLEIDNARIRATGLDGRITVATARRALSNADGSQVQLQGGAHVVRESLNGDVPVDFRSEFLHAFLTTERIVSHLPVVVQQGATVVRADGMDYDNVSRVVNFKGRARASFAPRTVPPRSAPAP